MKQIKINWKINQVILFFWFDPFQRLGQKSKNNSVGFLEEMKTRKFASEIYWPLAKRTHTHTPENITICILHENMFWKFPRRYHLIWIYVPDFVFWKYNKLNEYETDPCILYFLKCDSWLFVNFCVFTRSYLFLHGLQQVKTQKSTNS